MLLALVLAWAGQGVIFGQVAHGAGQHIGDVDKYVYMTGMKLNFVSQPIFLISICIVKLSVGCALLRIASTKLYRYLILSIMIFMAFYTVGCFFVSLAPSLIITYPPELQLTFISRPSSSSAQIFAFSGTTLSLQIAGIATLFRPSPTPMLPSTSRPISCSPSSFLRPCSGILTSTSALG